MPNVLFFSMSQYGSFSNRPVSWTWIFQATHPKIEVGAGVKQHHSLPIMGKENDKEDEGYKSLAAYEVSQQANQRYPGQKEKELNFGVPRH